MMILLLSMEVKLERRQEVVKKKKIMFFIYRLSYGGAARTMMNIVNHLDREKFEPILVTLDFTFEYEQFVKDDVTFIKLNTKRLRSAIRPLAKLIKQEQPDVLFSTIPNYNTIAILAKLLSRTKTKVVVREAAYLGGSIKENIKLRCYGMLYKFADKVVALSQGVKENVVKRYRINPKKITVIYNPVDLDYIEKAMLQPLSKGNQALFKGHDKIIVSIGRLVKEKDHATLLRAFQRVHTQISSKLVILGEGKLDSFLKSLAKQLQIEEQVYFIGFQENPYAFLKQADVFVLTSTTEGFGHVLVEAMATETPIVSTRCAPGGEEVLQNGKYGKICDVGNDKAISENIINVLNANERNRMELIRLGKERAQTFSVKQIVNQYEQLFLEILHNN